MPPQINSPDSQESQENQGYYIYKFSNFKTAEPVSFVVKRDFILDKRCKFAIIDVVN